MKKVRAEELQKGDKTSAITGKLETVESVVKKNSYCLIIFENGLSFHLQCKEVVYVNS